MYIVHLIYLLENDVAQSLPFWKAICGMSRLLLKVPVHTLSF